jgi:hypothetical protein
MHTLSSFPSNTANNSLFNLLSNTSKLSQSKSSLSNQSETNATSISNINSASSSSLKKNSSNLKNETPGDITTTNHFNSIISPMRVELENDSEENDEEEYRKEKEAFESDNNTESDDSKNKSGIIANNDDLDLDLDLIQNELKNSKTFIEELNAYASSTSTAVNNRNSSFSPVNLTTHINPYTESFLTSTFFSYNLPYGDFNEKEREVKNEKVVQIYEDDLIDRRDKLTELYKNNFFTAKNCYCDTKQNLFVYDGSKQNNYKLSKSLQRKLVNLYETFLSPNNVNAELASDLLYKKGMGFIFEKAFFSKMII